MSGIKVELKKKDADTIKEICASFDNKQDDLINVLHKVQQSFGYLPAEIQEVVANELNIPLAQVYGVVTFYSFFTMQPRGKHTVRVCLGTACYVRGGKKIAENVEKIFGIKEGETTPDRMFTYETVRCLGACGLGPVVVIDDNVHGRVKPDKLKDILNQYD